MREESKKVEVEAGATEGGRRPTGVAPAEGAVTGGLAPGQRWSAARKREVVLRMLRGEPVEALSRELGVEIYRLEKWRDKGLSGIDAALKEREGDPVQAELECGDETHRGTHDAKRAVVAAREEARPFGQAEVVEMSQTVSASTEATYGVERVCVVWEQARSTFYDRRERVQKLCQGIKPGKRGPQAAGAGRRASRSDSARSGGLALPRRRAPQGVGAVALRARATSVSQAGASAHAGEPTAVPLSWAAGASRSPQRDDHHRGSQPHVGNRRHEGVHA